MTRPQIVRAGELSGLGSLLSGGRRANPGPIDTLDLQDHDAPSAKDHTGQPAHPDPLGIGPAAPHQNATLRSMEEERTTEQGYLADAWSSNRNSHEGSELLDEDTDFLTNSSTLNRDSNMDERVGSQNGNTARSSEDSEMKDEEMEDADDDMVDKISSSPSIDEGKYPVFLSSPRIFRFIPGVPSRRRSILVTSIIIFLNVSISTGLHYLLELGSFITTSFAGWPSHERGLARNNACPGVHPPVQHDMDRRSLLPLSR